MFRISRETLVGAPSVATGVVAAAGGGQANATLLAADINAIGTVATLADSVRLPAAKAGMTVFVVNTTATSMQVFGTGTDTINAVAAATGVAQAAGVSAIYVCATDGSWRRLLSA